MIISALFSTPCYRWKIYELQGTEEIIAISSELMKECRNDPDRQFVVTFRDV